MLFGSSEQIRPKNLMSYLPKKYKKNLLRLFFRQNPRLFFNLFVPWGSLILTDQNSVNFITLHWMNLGEAAEKEIKVAFCNIQAWLSVQMSRWGKQLSLHWRNATDSYPPEPCNRLLSSRAMQQTLILQSHATDSYPPEPCNCIEEKQTLQQWRYRKANFTAISHISSTKAIQLY